jgi:hypothetical protein
VSFHQQHVLRAVIRWQREVKSGLGREGGFDGIHEFLQTKYIGVEI